MEEAYKPKTLPLKEIPEDVYKALIALQAEAKARCNCQRSLQAVVYSLIRKAAKDGAGTINESGDSPAAQGRGGSAL